MTAEKAHTDVRILETTVEYGVRDRLTGEVVTMPAWSSPTDALEALARSGYQFDHEDVLIRTTTVTETGWEAAS